MHIHMYINVNKCYRGFMVHCTIIHKQLIGEREEGGREGGRERGREEGREEGREGGREGGREEGRDTMYLTSYPPSKSDESVC